MSIALRGFPFQPQLFAQINLGGSSHGDIRIQTNLQDDSIKTLSYIKSDSDLSALCLCFQIPLPFLANVKDKGIVNVQ